jgi:hypothetical protein
VPACHRPSWNHSGSRSRRCCPPAPDTHPLGWHRLRIADRVVFDMLIQVLVFGCGYRRIADITCSATTLRRRPDEWISAGVADQLRLLVLAAYDQLFRLELGQLAVDGWHHQGALNYRLRLLLHCGVRWQTR